MRKLSGLRSWRFDSKERPTQPDESRALLSSCAGGCVKHPEPKSPERLLRTNAEWRRERALARSDDKKQVAHCARYRERVVCAPIFLFGWHWLNPNSKVAEMVREPPHQATQTSFGEVVF